MKNCVIVFLFSAFLFQKAFSQVDTAFIFNNNMPYGSLDIRLAKSDIRYYYLQEGMTFSYRENAAGQRTNTFADMTAWDSSPYGEGNLREKNGAEDLFVMNYRLLKPQGYQANRSYPLIVLFHGAGERANCWKNTCHHATSEYSPNENMPPAPTSSDHELLNNDHNLLHGARFYMDAVNMAGSRDPKDASIPDGAFPGFALFPQSLNGWNGSEAQDVIRIIRLLVKKYNIDLDRIYLTGLSNGGQGAFEALKRAPWLFSAGILMSPINDGFITNVNMQEKVAHVPLWIFQGALDTNPWPGATKNFVKKFRDAGATIRYTEYPDVGHTTWNSAFKEADYFPFLLGYNKAAIHLFSGSTAICDPAEGRTLMLPEGFKAYQWQKNGQTITNANGHRYKATEPGKYRARFSRISATPSENEWNEWSPEVELTMEEPPVATILQQGTVLLRDLNNNNQAVLRAGGDFAHYYWYKNGTLINFTGDQDDTVRTVILNPGSCNGTCANEGSYTLVTANFDNCKSAPSEPKHVYFSDHAPKTLSAPGDLRGKAESASTIKVQWKDNEAAETGYEIWRRRKVGDLPFSAWVMATLTEANATSYTDTSLFPSSTYQYKVRAVSAQARSEYSPAGSDGVEIATPEDKEAPGVPDNFKALRKGLDKVVVRWSPAEDDSKVSYYVVTMNGDSLATRDTTVTYTGLPVNETFLFTVAAVDVGGNAGEATHPAGIFTGVNGLYYEHSPGGWTSLDSIDYSMPEYTGFVDNFTLAPKTQEDYFYFRFDGYLYITSPGSYQFRTSSDDGSRLYLKGKRIVNNNGIQDLTTVTSGGQTLAEGPHRITVDFFDYTETDSLRVEYKGPDTQNAWKVIPAEALKSTLIVAAEPDQTNPLVVQVFPNPASQSNLNVQVQSLTPQPVAIHVIDGMGRSIFAREYAAEEVREGVKITAETKLHAGLYFIRVSQSNPALPAGAWHVQQKVIIRD